MKKRDIVLKLEALAKRVEEVEKYIENHTSIPYTAIPYTVNKPGTDVPNKPFVGIPNTGDPLDSGTITVCGDPGDHYVNSADQQRLQTTYKPPKIATLTEETGESGCYYGGGDYKPKRLPKIT